MSASFWAAATAYNIGDVVQPVTDAGTGFFFRCVVAGVSGTTEPSWPTALRNTTPDGTCEWMAVSIIAGDFQELAPSSIIEMFELQIFRDIHNVNETYRFHAGSSVDGNREIIWKGQRYMQFPIEADGFEYNGQGTLPRPKIRISNIFGTITAILLSLPNGLEGAKVTRIRTLAKYLDSSNLPAVDALLQEDGDELLFEDDTRIMLEPFSGFEDTTQEFPREIYYIDRKSSENRDVVEFELASAFDLAGFRLPKRQCIANVCPWRYRGAECGYTGGDYFDAADQPVTDPAFDVCGKRLNSCKIRFGQNAELPYGGFPGIGAAVF